jgi:hypothetical protein
VNIDTARTERKRVADMVAGARLWVEGAFMNQHEKHHAEALREFERAVREDERWELMARSEANPT